MDWDPDYVIACCQNASPQERRNALLLLSNHNKRRGVHDDGAYRDHISMRIHGDFEWSLELVPLDVLRLVASALLPYDLLALSSVRSVRSSLNIFKRF